MFVNLYYIFKQKSTLMAINSEKLKQSKKFTEKETYAIGRVKINDYTFIPLNTTTKTFIFYSINNSNKYNKAIKQ